MDVIVQIDATITEPLEITAAQKRQISLDLEQYHRIFDVFWTLSTVQFVPANHRFKTAAVNFPKGVGSQMFINVAFWNGLNDDEQLFVILHECLHVMLDHGIRNARNVPGATPYLINVAQDITINEMIVDLFNLPRGLLADWKRYCWIETCFADPTKIERNQVFEYYLRKLIEDPSAIKAELVDEHDGESGGWTDGDPDPLAQEIGKYLSDDELNALLEKMKREDGRGISMSPYNVILEQRTPERIDFNQLIKNLKRSAKARDDREEDSFARSPRRLAGTNMILPGRIGCKPQHTKLITALFFDVSGSCMTHLHKFHDCAMAFDREEKLFDVRTFAFDTRVKELKRGEQVGVGGGTSFDIIETKCREIELETGRYPDCVVVLTDGAGNQVHPLHPTRWVWLLTPRATKSYIPYGCRAWPIDRVVLAA